jgi:hypothetical protein
MPTPPRTIEPKAFARSSSPGPVLTTASVIASVLLGVVSIFQIALALGLPAGRAAWGGRHEGKLPPGLRVASGIAGLVLYPIIILLVLTAEVRSMPATRYRAAVSARSPSAVGSWPAASERGRLVAEG